VPCGAPYQDACPDSVEDEETGFADDARAGAIAGGGAAIIVDLVISSDEGGVAGSGRREATRTATGTGRSGAIVALAAAGALGAVVDVDAVRSPMVVVVVVLGTVLDVLVETRAKATCDGADERPLEPLNVAGTSVPGVVATVADAASADA
jgi:hypothetical protein